MRRNIMIAFAAVMLVTAFFVFSCQKNEKVSALNKPDQSADQHEVLISSLSPEARGAVVKPLISYGCGSGMSGSYSGNGYYKYPSYALDVSGVDTGGTISISVSSYDVPNRFTVYDVNNFVVAYTGWMGNVTYAGPWGTSLNTPENAILKFIRGAASSYSLVVETVTNARSDNWLASMSCAYVPNVKVIQVTDVGTKNTMVAAFKSLTDNVTALGADLGLGHALSLADLDTTKIYQSYDSNEYNHGSAITVAFKNNSNSQTYNYGFTLFKDDSTYFHPEIIESKTGSDVYFYDLGQDSTTTVANYNTSSFTFTTVTGNYQTAPTGGCGQRTMNCISDVYTGHGWASVWAFVQTAFIPETAAAFAIGCAIKNCR
jgi:hypothetical protein